MQQVTRGRATIPALSESHPIFPLNGRRHNPREHLDGTDILFVVEQVDSPFVPTSPSEVGKTGVGAKRVFAADEQPAGWELGSTQHVYHVKREEWWGTWEIQGVRWPGGETSGIVPDEKLGLWKLVQDPVTKPVLAKADQKAGQHAEDRASARAAERVEGSGVGDFVIYRSSEGGEYPALVTITPGSFDVSMRTDSPEIALSESARSLIVFRPSGSSYARHNIRRQLPSTPDGVRSWRARN
jgi:hypothetical protein